MLVAFIRPVAPAVGHIIVSGTRVGGYVQDAVALCGYSTEKAQVDVAVMVGDKLSDVDCKKCLKKLERKAQLEQVRAAIKAAEDAIAREV